MVLIVLVEVTKCPFPTTATVSLGEIGLRRGLNISLFKCVCKRERERERERERKRKEKERKKKKESRV